MRAVVKGEAPLTEQTVSALTADESWITLKLPLTTPITGDDNLWLDDYRQQGLATNLHLLMHSDVKRYLGIATMHIRSRRTINLHTGAELGKVWLNGECVYKSSGLTGWHAGRDSVSVNLIKGENRLVIETGANFFLSMTKDSFWK